MFSNTQICVFSMVGQKNKLHSLRVTCFNFVFNLQQIQYFVLLGTNLEPQFIATYSKSSFLHAINNSINSHPHEFVMGFRICNGIQNLY